MMRLIIADDEPLVRFHLRSLIMESDPSITVIEAANGEELVNLVRQGRADGALVDVRMPKKTGLAAIKELQNEGFDVSWGVLSSYSDFAYAREALALGALGYALKPPSLEETKELLEKIQHRVVLKKRERITAFERFWTSKGVLGNQRLFNPGPPISLERENGEGGDLFIPLVFAIDGQPSSERLRDLISERLSQTYDGTFLAALRDGTLPLTLEGLGVVSEGSRYPERMAKAIGFWNGVYALLGSLKTETAGSLRVMGIMGEPCGTWEAQEERMETLRSLVAYRPLMPALLLSSQKAETLIQRYPATILHAAQELSRLMEGILRGDLQRVPALLIDTQALLVQTGTEESRLFLRYLESALGCSFFSPSSGDTDAPDFWPQGWKRVFDAPLWSRLIHPSIAPKNATPTDQKPVVQSIKAYLQRHGFEGITLATAARDLGFTPNYLSFLFHRQTGTTFTEYITELRLQRARELLWSGKSVKESAWAVGYGSERHFARLYRHRFGFSPAEDKQNRGNVKKS